MRLRLAATVAGVVLASGGRADAGRTHYGWLSASEVDPERGVELETWIIEEDGVGYTGSERETFVWWAPVVGITDHLELALPIEAYEGGLGRYGAELRWRPDSPDELEQGAFTTVVRGGAKRVISAHDALHLEAGVVVAYQHDRIHAEVDAGAVLERRPDVPVALDLRPGAGISVRTIEDLRFGAEVYAELRVTDEEVGEARDWVALGPDVGWTHGRFWASAALLVGVYQIDWAPRINFAVAF
jgi:hypothetical protein